MAQSYLFSSESVTEGHPDKVADQISDAILDTILTDDKNCRVACETLVTTGMAIIAGEITTDVYVDMPSVVRETIKQIGYNDSSMGFDWETCAVLTSIDKQSPDIAIGVNAKGKKEQGAGDQGIMFGFACDETETMMPMPIHYAHGLTKRLAQARKEGILNFLRPDGKSQVTIQYENGSPCRAEAIVVSAQHTPDVKSKDLKEGIMEEVIRKVIPADLLYQGTKIFINPTGRFVVGGPMGDCGLTGRKIIVDTYGGKGSHGGGCFSGKDPSKVDRSASYMARYAAKNIIAAGLAKSCEVQLAYAIGVAKPVSILVDTFGTGTIRDREILKAVNKVFSFKPADMIDHLDLLRPIYKKTACYGHYGRQDKAFTWEKTDKAKELREAAGLSKPKGKKVKTK